MILRIVKSVLFIICIIGLLFLPMSNIFLYDRPLIPVTQDFARIISEKAEHTDYHSSDISTFVNDKFIFYVPPPTYRALNTYRPDDANGLRRAINYNDYPIYQKHNVANLSSIQIFSYENGAEVQVEWLNGTVINGTTYDEENDQWYVDRYADITWIDHLTGPKELKKKITLDEYTSKEIQLTEWVVANDYRLLSGVVRITSDNPISVMHHKLYPTRMKDNNGYQMLNPNWNGVYSAYGKKLYTRITGDCWVSALEANTKVNVWDDEKNDDAEFTLDRFEGWAYSRNAIFQQYGFDNANVLIAADKPVSIVAGIQSDQAFVQVFGKDGRDFHFPCFGYVLIHALKDTKIELKDKSGNQGTFDGEMSEGQMKVIDFRVAYKQRKYSSFEWAELRSSEPVIVYTFANSSWYLSENNIGKMSGEEYAIVYKKITQFYPHGLVPYPASTNFKLPLRSRATVTVVNLENSGNKVELDFSRLKMPYKTRLNSYQTVTIDFSEDSYYKMNLINPDTGSRENPSWLTRDPDNHFYLDHIPRIAVQERNRQTGKEDPDTEKLTQKVSWENLTKGSTVKIKAEHPVLVLINYEKDYNNIPLGIDLIPGLTPPTFRGLPDVPTMIVIISGIVIAVDMIAVAIGRSSIVEVFKKR